MPSSPQYLFHHLPKCGGNSLRIAFAQWFLITYDYRARSHFPDQEQSVKDFVSQQIDLSKLPDNALVFGHFDTSGAYLWQRYPEIYHNGTRLITFLRDPLERALSHYFFGVKTGYLPIKQNNLHAFLHACHNPMARLLSPDEKIAQDILAPYWFVGTLEKIDTDLTLFAKRAHKSAPINNAAHVNQTSRPSYCLPHSLIADFKAQNALDYELFALAQSHY